MIGGTANTITQNNKNNACIRFNSNVSDNLSFQFLNKPSIPILYRQQTTNMTPTFLMKDNQSDNTEVQQLPLPAPELPVIPITPVVATPKVVTPDKEDVLYAAARRFFEYGARSSTGISGNKTTTHRSESSHTSTGTSHTSTSKNTGLDKPESNSEDEGKSLELIESPEERELAKHIVSWRKKQKKTNKIARKKKEDMKVLKDALDESEADHMDIGDFVIYINERPKTSVTLKQLRTEVEGISKEAIAKIEEYIEGKSTSNLKIDLKKNYKKKGSKKRKDTNPSHMSDSEEETVTEQQEIDN